MCLICAAQNSSDPLAGFDQHTSVLQGTDPVGSGGAGESAPYTLDQIAGQLTDGYWNSGGGSWRAFDLGATRTLTYDLTFLSADAAAIAVAALEAWSAVSGIVFQNVSSIAYSLNSEVGDAADSIATTQTVGTATLLEGTISSSTDQDFYRVSLIAGQTYVFEVRGGASGPVSDSTLRLLDSGGTQIIYSDDTAGSLYSSITFTATSTGIHYLDVGGFGTSTGSYELIVDNVSADIVFQDTDGSGAYAYSDLSGNEILRSYINIYDSWSPLNQNGYMLQTYIHELGHALGLGHAGNYNGSASWPGNALYDNDSWSTTIMSYFDQTDNTFDPASYAYLASVMTADAIAIQNLYGYAATGLTTGNTVWGPGGNSGGALQILLNMWGGVTAVNPAIYAGNPLAFLINDDGGIDTMDFSVFSQNQQILLTALARSDIAGLIDNVVIARNVVIENAKGGAGNDEIIGNTANNKLEGNAGRDSILGGAGNDQLYGGTGNDTLLGEEGNDNFYGGSGNDSIDGGDGTDRYYYTGTSALTVDLSVTTAQNTGAGTGTDIIQNVENVTGGSGNDSLTGSSGNNSLDGGAGNDTINSGLGSDYLMGGAGDDSMDGGAGIDRVFYNGTASVSVSLSVTTAQNTGAATGVDTLRNIENITSGSGHDRLVGNILSNSLVAGSGNDTLYGMTGNDSLIGDAGNDQLYGSVGNDILTGGTGQDDFIFNSTLGATNVDRITDFAVADDTILVDDAFFTALSGSALAATAFASNLTGAATSALHRIIYESDTGFLFYDADGTGAGARQQFATLSAGLTLTAADFLIV